MRLHQPTGIWLLLLPCLWGFALAGGGFENWRELALFIIGAILMRGAGCIINDMADRKFDAEVERTKNRPLASGALTMKQAFMLLAGLLGISFVILLQFNRVTILLGVLSIIPVVIYPFMKRFTYWPQAFLGLTFNWGALMGYAAIKGNLGISAILLYAAGFFWTLGYDTIYACQDTRDDIMAGVKSTALRLQSALKKWLSSFYIATIIMLAMAMIAEGYRFHSLLYLVIPLLHCGWQVWFLNPASPQSALKIFKSNVITGIAIFLALLSE